MPYKQLPALLLALVCVHCASDNDLKVRAEKPYSIGYPGASYRPLGNAQINFTSPPASSGSVHIDRRATNSADAIAEGEYRVDATEVAWSRGHVDVDALYFPFESSAFYIGLGLRQQTTRVAFYDGTDTDSPQTKTAYDTRMTKVPFGWYLIQESGFTLQLGLTTLTKTYEGEVPAKLAFIRESIDSDDSSRHMDLMVGYSF